MSRYTQALTRMQRTWGMTADIYAPGSATGGTASDMTLVSASAVGLLVPVTDQHAAGLIVSAPLGLADGRTEHLWVDSGTASLGFGCEVRTSAGTYAVHGTADWRIGRVALLSRLVTPFVPAAAVSGAGTINLVFNRAANSHYVPFV